MFQLAPKRIENTKTNILKILNLEANIFSQAQNRLSIGGKAANIIDHSRRSIPLTQKTRRGEKSGLIEVMDLCAKMNEELENLGLSSAKTVPPLRDRTGARIL